MRGRMMMVACLAAGTAGAIGTAGATELQVQLASQRVPDPSFGLVSDEPSVSTFGLRVARPLRPALNLSWVASYEYGARQNDGYGTSYYEDAVNAPYEGSVDTRLAFHGLEAGVRWSLPVGRLLSPYLGLSAKGYVGALTLSDDLTGWSQPDPADPTGEASLYELKPALQLGAGVGLQGTAGLAVWLAKPDKPRRVALAMAEPETVPGAPASSPEAAAPAAGSPAQETPSSDVPTPAPIGAHESKPQRFGLGLNLEVGYLHLLTGLRFADAGSLDVHGIRVQGGILMMF